MKPSEYPKASAENAAKLIDEAINLIEKNGWWNGRDNGVRRDPEDPDSLPHCAVTAMSVVSVQFLGYQEAYDALAAEIPKDFKLTYGSFEPFTWVTMYNDYTNKPTVLAWMRRAAEKLRKDSNDISTSPVVGRGELAEAGTSSDPSDVQPPADASGAGAYSKCCHSREGVRGGQDPSVS
jgi:hypothetical protein